MKITKQALLDRGFRETVWAFQDGKTDYIFTPKYGGYAIEVNLEDKTVKVAKNSSPISVPNCRTLKQLDALIDLFLAPPLPPPGLHQQ